MRGLGVLGLALVFATAAAAGLKPLPLSARVIQRGEFPGFVSLPGQSTALFKTPQKWVGGDTQLTASQKAADEARLRKEGFVAVLSRQLGTPKQERWDGLSWVMQLGSAAAARAELAATVRETKATTKAPGTYTAFAVPGVPGAHGYNLGGPTSSGDNVVFADGPFLYLVGYGWGGSRVGVPPRSRLLGAVQHLYHRVHGHPPA